MSHGPRPPRTGPSHPPASGYGQFPAPGYSPGPPQKKSRRGIVIAVVAVVLAVAAGGGAWWLLSDGTSGEKAPGFAEQADTQLSLLMDERYPDDWKPDASTAHMSMGSHLDGRWWTGRHFVREMWNEVVAYDLADGSVAWRVPVAGNGACLASRAAAPDGLVAIMRGEPIGATGGPKPCDRLTLVDINAGKELWTVTLQPGDAKKHTAANRPVVWGDFVFVATGAGGFRYRLADGAPAGRGPGSCAGTDYATSGDTLMIWEKCRDGRILAGYGPDLTMRWRWQVPGKDVRPRVLSADPLVVVVESGGEQQVWRVTPGDEKDPGEHTVLMRIPRQSLEPMPACPLSRAVADVLPECAGAIVGDGVLYLRYALDANYRTTGIVAFDLDSGKERWRADAGGELSLGPVGLDEDGRLIAFQPQSPDSAARAAIVAVDPGTGNVTPLAGLPSGKESGLTGVLGNNSLAGDITWRDGRFTIATPGVVVAEQSAGGGPGSLATVVFS